MRRGTTPIIIMRVPCIDYDEIAEWYITFKQANTEITKTGDDVKIKGDKLIVTFTEEETMRFMPTEIDVQIRMVSEIGTVLATKVKHIDTDRILFNEVI